MIECNLVLSCPINHVLEKVDLELRSILRQNNLPFRGPKYAKGKRIFGLTGIQSISKAKELSHFKDPSIITTFEEGNLIDPVRQDLLPWQSEMMEQYSITSNPKSNLDEHGKLKMGTVSPTSKNKKSPIRCSCGGIMKKRDLSRFYICKRCGETFDPCLTGPYLKEKKPTHYSKKQLHKLQQSKIIKSRREKLGRNR